MRILFVTEFFPSDLELKFTGGVEARTFFVTKLLAKNNQVSVICRKTKELTKSRKINNISIYPCGFLNLNIEANLFSVIERIIYIIIAFIKGLSLDFDLVEGSNFVSYLPAFLLGVVKKKPAVAWFPDILGKNWIKFFGLTGLFGLIMEKISLKLFWTKIIALSFSTKEKLMKSGIKENKIKVIYGGVEQNKFKIMPVKQSMLYKTGKNLKLKIEKKNIICISRLVKYKKVDNLIKAFAVLSKQNKDLTLTIVGQGPEERQLKILVRDINLNEKVKFLKNLTRYDLIKTLRQSYLFCLPSIIEGFGLVTIEAAACQTPYVISDIKVNKEITKNGLGGLLFKVDDPKDLKKKIEILLEDKKLYQQKQQEDLLLTKDYNWQKIVQQTYKFYQEALK